MQKLKEKANANVVEMNCVRKQNKGITLVALIITIIVMLILVGVTISMVVDDDSILNQAELAGDKQIYATTEEKIKAQCEYITEGENAGKVDLSKTEENIRNLNLEEIEQISSTNTLLTIMFKDGNRIEISGVNETKNEKNIEYYISHFSDTSSIIQKLDYGNSECTTYNIYDGVYDKNAVTKFTINKLDEDTEIKLYSSNETANITSGATVGLLELNGNTIIGSYFQNNIMYALIIENDVLEELLYIPFDLITEETKIAEIETEIEKIQ